MSGGAFAGGDGTDDGRLGEALGLGLVRLHLLGVGAGVRVAVRVGARLRVAVRVGVRVS